MSDSIPEAWSIHATRRASGYKVEPALSEPPEALGWTRDDWDGLTPGMKREIERGLRRKGELADICSPPAPKQNADDHRRAVEYAGRKRL